MKLVFWGTRGSLPMNTPNHRLFGGNTSCIGVHASDSLVIFDAGSGLIHLGSELAQTGRKEVDICFSHFHSDHICGLPFFKPLFDADMKVRLHSFGDNETSLHDALDSYLSRPIFPIGLDDFTADVQFIHHAEGESVDFGDLHISSLPIPHPGGAHALKATAHDKNFVYATDTEHTKDAPNQELIGFMQAVDLAVYDCTYDDSEFEERRGWGHSTWQEGVRLAQAAGVAQFGIFHHEPERSDEMLLDIETRAKQMLPNSFVTRDFMRIEI
ncbi:MAG: MBL fold metallo-hydrolase [Parvibaculales bacterium]